VTVLRQVVALWRARCGLAEGASDEEVRGRVRDQAGAVRELSIGLSKLGLALADAQQPAEAVTVHRQEVALKRALCGLAEGASDEEVRARVRDQAGAVRELSIGLSKLGSALADAQQPAEAVTVHRQDVALCRALCGLAEGASDEEIRARVRDQAGAVLELSIGLLNLGSISNGKERQTVFGEGKRLVRFVRKWRKTR
jgi:Zn ribbon nucleic-acid-binding protein